MDELLKKIDDVLKAGLPGATTELELLPPLSKISGFVFWDGFEDQEQLERQQRIWELLKGHLPQDEQLRVSAIFTLTPHENSVIREH